MLCLLLCSTALEAFHQLNDKQPAAAPDPLNISGGFRVISQTSTPAKCQSLATPATGSRYDLGVLCERFASFCVFSCDFCGFSTHTVLSRGSIRHSDHRSCWVFPRGPDLLAVSFRVREFLRRGARHGPRSRRGKTRELVAAFDQAGACQPPSTTVLLQSCCFQRDLLRSSPLWREFA